MSDEAAQYVLALGMFLGSSVAAGLFIGCVQAMMGDTPWWTRQFIIGTGSLREPWMKVWLVVLPDGGPHWVRSAEWATSFAWWDVMSYIKAKHLAAMRGMKAEVRWLP